MTWHLLIELDGVGFIYLNWWLGICWLKLMMWVFVYLNWWLGICWLKLMINPFLYIAFNGFDEFMVMFFGHVFAPFSLSLSCQDNVYFMMMDCHQILVDRLFRWYADQAFLGCVEIFCELWYEVMETLQGGKGEFKTSLFSIYFI